MTSFFDGLKSVLGDIFAAARKLVNAAIEGAKKLAVGIIETARKAVVGLIRLAGDALIAIGDVVLAGFPNLRDRFRKGVEDRVKAAEDAVNKLADALKAGVQKLLDLLGKAINVYLGLLECAYMAAVNAVASVVKGAIEFAKNVVQALAAFAELIKDVAADPIGWISNLGSSVVSGLKNCFWNAFKSAVKNWFNSKVEEVLGLPMLIFKMLFKGCIKMKDIGKMAWQGLKAAIPMVLVQLLIEKLVAMIVPAAGAILTIIEGLRAAWPAVSRIIAAFALFFIFLKAVRGGNAGGAFATALAAAGIVVIDFIANWLLLRLRKPAGAVAGKLRVLAQKIAKGLKKGFAAVKKGAKAVGRALKRGTKAAVGAMKRGAKAGAGAIKRGAQAAGRGLKRGAQAVGRGVKRGAQAVKRGAQAVGRGVQQVGRAIAKTRVGKALIRGARAVQRGYARARAAVQRKRQQFKEWREKRKKQTAEERLARARKALEPKIAALLRRGVSRFRLRLQLGLWRVFYRLSRLHVRGSGSQVEIHAVVNPEATIGRGLIVDRDEVFRTVTEMGRDLTKRTRGSLGEQTGPLTLGAREDPTRLGVGIADRPPELIPGKGKTVPIDVGGETVFGKQGAGTSNVIIQGLGKYPQITEKLAAQGLTGPALSKSVMETLRTGKGPLDVKRFIALTFGTEVARSSSTAVTAPLTMIGMQQGSLTTPEAYGGPGAPKIEKGGGLFPPSQEQFVKTQARSEERVGGREFDTDTKIHAASEENIRRTVQLVTKVTQEMSFNDVAHFRRKAGELLERYYPNDIGRKVTCASSLE